MLTWVLWVLLRSGRINAGRYIGAAVGAGTSRGCCEC